ncbi:hypothetical protein TWF225_002459 [Orbilia oligospora]|uniref:Acylphosphatase n=1 Tax=Orbilia oligospora TaxID=2813651 RepID=A0A7C8PHR5_ORBOL|nr:hypothetical protein TWF751_008519 [Orbilia oligospora]KAF3189952.1 hypothetical protein TWF225_002459 [Orbilia oligospora]KAF3266305.1 hypothetical protein TWF217_001975 [Orbilia oligospora]KAF3268572.1 hypothetical protein TWF128_006964 [Orbilia oligospora]KAF3297037.1 hypothetical protein TWF132_008407 [Orbilia oligospora]
MSVRRYTFTVHGYVQGVFFRKYTQNSANALSISGFVRNLPNGNVGGEAEGSPDKLEEFRQKLEQGSDMSTVQKVEWDEIEARKEDEGQGYMKAISSERFSIAKSHR